MADTAAIILGAGRGLRFGGPVRKQYLRLKGKPLLWWSLSAFDQSRSVRELILVIPAPDLDAVARQVRSWRLRKLSAIVAGGAERSDSVKAGLGAVTVGSRYVAVHDGVRPLIQPRDIERILSFARRHGAALAAIPSRDTVKIADAKGFVQDSPDRAAVWMAQTPQCFKRALLQRAHDRQRHPATDDAQLVERLGSRVKLVACSSDNIKVTLPADLLTARAILKGSAV